MAGECGAPGGPIRPQGKLKREDKSPSETKKNKKMPHETISTLLRPLEHITTKQRGIDSRSNDRDRHSNSIITTFTIKRALNILYLHFRPGLGLFCAHTRADVPHYGTKNDQNRKQPCKRR